MLVHAMREHGVDVWGDGSTYKGNDIERFFRYGLLANPALRIYKPWLDPLFVSELGGRKEMSEWLVEREPAVPRRASRRRTRPTRTSGARRTRRRSSSSSTGRCSIVEPIMGVAHWDPAVEIAPEVVTVRFEEGWPVALNGVALRRPRRARARGERDRRPPRARDVRPDREPDHRGEEPRHLRGAGDGAPLPRLRAPRQRDPQRVDDRRIPDAAAGGSAGCSTRAAGSTRRR